MKRQMSFAEAESAGKKRVTRRQRFLNEMEKLVPWSRLLTAIEPYYPKGARGRPPATGAKVVIPPRSNRKTKRRYSRALYRTRNLVERFFNSIKQFRRVSTRYDKLADSYLVFAPLACAFGPFVKM